MKKPLIPLVLWSLFTICESVVFALMIGERHGMRFRTAMAGLAALIGFVQAVVYWHKWQETRRPNSADRTEN